jgi:predicted membrane protein
MNFSVFGGLKHRPFPPGWTKETVVAILGGGDIDLSSSPPGADARLTAVAILGGVKIILPPGTRVSVSGMALLGGRDVKVSQVGQGPEVKMSLWTLLGGIEVAESEPTTPSDPPQADT